MINLLKKIQLFCKKGLRTLNLIGNIYLVVATDDNGVNGFKLNCLSYSPLIILKKFLTWSCNFGKIIKLSVR